MDNRLEKFSFDERQLKAVEDAITLVVAYDVVEHIGKPKQSMLRFGVLQTRLTRSGRDATYVLGVQPVQSRLDAQAGRLAMEIEATVRAMTPLHCVLLLVELCTASPYAESSDQDVVKLSPTAEAREKVIRRLVSIMNLRLAAPKDITALVDGVTNAVADAGRAHTSYGLLFKIIGSGALAIIAGLFAGPIIGGLVGTYLLGLSGAAAVSAGLALLGGGALAAGGFGMVGGSIVVATAFGAAGAGASTMFLGKDGDVAARLAYIKHQAAFACLTRLGLMDHELAEDFIGSTESELTRYRDLAKGKSATASESAKVADVIETALDWIRTQYANATKIQLIRRVPVAWDRQEASTAGVEDADVRALLDRAVERERTIERCVWLLQNANQSYNAVRGNEKLTGLLGMLDKGAHDRLLRGNAFLREVSAEVIALALAQQSELAEVVAVVGKIADLQREQERQVQITERYRQLTLQLYREVNALQQERDDLRAENAALRSAASAALFHGVVAEARRASTTSRLGTGSQAQTAESNGEVTRDVLAGARLAVLLGYDESAVRAQLGPRAASLGSRGELERTMEDFGLPLGTPLDKVRKRRRQLLAEVHPDKVASVSPAVQRALRAAAESHETAFSLHVAYQTLVAPAQGAA